jgi:F0F1-type ATP synthase assembly protein I
MTTKEMEKSYKEISGTTRAIAQARKVILAQEVGIICFLIGFTLSTIVCAVKIIKGGRN